MWLYGPICRIAKFVYAVWRSFDYFRISCNQFKEQEKGSDQDIASFCQVNYGVTFPLFQKADVKGINQHPVYQWLSNPAKNGWNKQEPVWNFSKYLIDEEGRLTHYMDPSVSPLDPRLIKAIAP